MEHPSCLILVVAFTLMTSVLDLLVASQSCASVTTFNTGLTPVVARVDKRIGDIKTALRAEQSDVLCLQEVWYERSVRELTEGLEDVYPHHYSKLHKRVSQLDLGKRSSFLPWLRLFATRAACTSKELAYMVTTLGACALKHNCVGTSIPSVGGCMATKCREELRSKELSQSCLSCALFSLRTITTTLTQCAPIVGKDNRFNGPGLVLMSKKKILGVRYVNYFPQNKLFAERGYLEARIEDVGRVVCTHLSANMEPYLEFDTYFKNYNQQQAAEIRRLFRFQTRDHILMGDLNTGPALTFPFKPSRNISANFATNYVKLMAYGYQNPYIQNVRLCTYCTTNSFTKGSKNHILDHVLLKGNNFRGIHARRVLSSFENRDLSDHMGVQAKFCKVPSSVTKERFPRRRG